MTLAADPLDLVILDRLEELREAIRGASNPAEVRRYRLAVEQLVLECRGPQAWLRELFPAHFSGPFAPFHDEFWQWVWRVTPGVRPDAFVGIWFRNAGKSSATEAAVAALGARGRRRYMLYCADSQDRADDHVTNVALLLEDERLAKLYPSFARRKLGKYGPQRGWRRNRLWTETGFTIDALGLDRAVRGVKLEDRRPDGLVFDDIDKALDTEGTIRRHVTTITRDILPAGSTDVAVMAVQNLVHPEGVFARLADLVPEGAAFSELLTRRVVSGPIPAAEGLVIERRDDPSRPGRTRATIVAGRPTWERNDLGTLQAALDDFGETAFLAEYQHKVDQLEGAMFENVLPLVRRVFVSGPDRATDADGIDGLHELVARLDRTTVWCDPAVTDKDSSDSYGVQADGIDSEGTIWRLRSWEQRSSPRATLGLAIRWAYELGSGHVGVETDQGGDTWYDVYDRSLGEVLDEEPSLRGLPVPIMLEEKAGTGHGPKQERGARMLADYERPGPPIVHVYGYPDDSTALDEALGRVFIRKPFDLADACLHGDTPVLTTGGWLPIRDAEVGAAVATRSGWGRVSGAGQTGQDREVVRAALSDGHAIIGTPNHPVWTVEHGWSGLGDCAGLTVLASPTWDDVESYLVRPLLVPRTVVAVTPAGRADVWNLEVEGDHEYVAGIVVHNSYWAWRYLRVTADATTGLDAARSLGPIRRR